MKKEVNGMKGLCWEVTVKSKNPQFHGDQDTYLVSGADCHVAARKGLSLARAAMLSSPRVTSLRLIGEVVG